MKKHIFFSPAYLLAGSLFLIGGVCVSPPSAQAGFQWVSPSDSAPAPEPTYQMPAPQPAPSYAPSQPLIIMGNPPPAAAPAPAPSPAPALMAPAPKMEAPAEKAVQGFANNVPLAVALRQILPPDYGFSVAQDVNLATLVSWRGGKSWHETLKDMLQTVGLSMREQGQMINIVRGAEAPMAAAPAPAPMMQPAPQPMPLAPSSVPERPLPRNVDTGGSSHVLQLPPSMQAAPIMPQQQQAVVDSWTANRGDTLRKVLEDWCRRANVELSWQAEYDYPLQASVSLTGTFEEATRNLLIGFQDAQPHPIASLYNNPAAGQTVMVVKTLGNNYSE